MLWFAIAGVVLVLTLAFIFHLFVKGEDDEAFSLLMLPATVGLAAVFLNFILSGAGGEDKVVQTDRLEKVAGSYYTSGDDGRYKVYVRDGEDVRVQEVWSVDIRYTDGEPRLEAVRVVGHNPWLTVWDNLMEGTDYNIYLPIEEIDK